MRARLVLENGIVFTGKAFGDVSKASTGGEVVFTTALTGYQEILTDPSFAGQIVTMTNPLIGNYGTNHEDLESSVPHVAGFIVRENSEEFSNWRSDWSLQEYLQTSNILGIEGIDTRRLVRILRTEGALRGIVSAEESSDADLIAKANELPLMTGLDLTKGVTTEEIYSINGKNEGDPHVVVIDYGIKYNILRKLHDHGAKVTVVPSTTKFATIRELAPQGVFLSNGPGDPDAVKDGIETVKDLLAFEQLPVFGICLGNQLLSLAYGGETYKLKFGHRGANHPVKNLRSDKIEITAQNHGFAVKWGSMPDSCELTHINLNDQTVEGFRHKELPVFAVQYHPEASPGPHESDYLFTEFIENIKK
ncbi:MAG TPA: glutamine-hydrolyzing carbamoyl-phosphate synthase small subunit [Candidatus Kapabacteria bacterium]|nr:glutamine-hydrolyzing carbamoyl-phosphate synthase small subunit [Candidatus Kapabacteria bacterium]